MGEVPGLDNLIHIRTLTGRSIDWLLTGDEKTIEAQSTLDYPEYRTAATESVDSLISKLIDARVAPLEREITQLRAALRKKSS